MPSRKFLTLALLAIGWTGPARSEVTSPPAAGPDKPWEVSPWPEADALFHRDPQWLGGDDAGSLDLGDGRVVWFFGDSFVAPPTPRERRGSTMVHNSVGLQTGYDPTQATFKTYWRQCEGKPCSFIADEGPDFFWPGGSRLVEGKLLVFLMRARRADTKLKFRSTGWGVVLIENPSDTPDRWRVRKLAAPQNPFKVLVGSASVLLEGEHLVALSVADDTHDVFLVRWRASDAVAGDLSQPEWWAGEPTGWTAQHDLKTLPTPLLRPGETEFTVHRSESEDRYVQYQFMGFPREPIGVRTAPQLTGPWSPQQAVVRPQEIDAQDTGLMCYAAKAHPELAAPGLSLTYCTNTFSWPRLFDDPQVYYPRFMIVKAPVLRGP